MFLHTALTLCKSLEGFLQLRRIQHSLAQRGARPPPPSHGPSLVSVQLRCFQFRRYQLPVPPVYARGEPRAPRFGNIQAQSPAGESSCAKAFGQGSIRCPFCHRSGVLSRGTGGSLPFLTRILEQPIWQVFDGSISKTQSTSFGLRARWYDSTTAELSLVRDSLLALELLFYYFPTPFIRSRLTSCG